MHGMINGDVNDDAKQQRPDRTTVNQEYRLVSRLINFFLELIGNYYIGKLEHIFKQFFNLLVKCYWVSAVTCQNRCVHIVYQLPSIQYTCSIGS